MSVKYCWSRNEEHGFDGDHATLREAQAEAANAVGEGESFYVGEMVSPPQPELLWDAVDWLEHVSCQDSYGGDHADGWDCSTKRQRAELEEAVSKVMAEWLDRHELRPAFFNVENMQHFRVASLKDDGSFELETLE